MSDSMSVQIIWSIDPADPEKTPFVYMARDEESIANDPQEWEAEVSEEVKNKGHKNVRITTVSVDFEAVRKSFEPVDVSVKPKLTTSTLRGGSVLPVGAPIRRDAEGFLVGDS